MYDVSEPEKVSPLMLVAGEKYTFEFSDCCIGGMLTGKFLKYGWDEFDEEKDVDYADLVFDIGTVGPAHNVTVWLA